MLKDLREFRVDRERAIRIGAVAGLSLLGVSTLPGLLETPDPPPVPADVGFLPAEMNRYTAPSGPAEPLRQEKARRRPSKEDHGRGKAGRERRRGEWTRFGKKRRSKQDQERRHGKGSQASEAAASPVTAPPAAPVLTPSTPPAPTYSPPAGRTEPAPPPPVPEATVAPSPLPSDGSQEFAPR